MINITPPPPPAGLLQPPLAAIAHLSLLAFTESLKNNNRGGVGGEDPRDAPIGAGGVAVLKLGGVPPYWPWPGPYPTSALSAAGPRVLR